jgi:hypothetical protein
MSVWRGVLQGMLEATPRRWSRLALTPARLESEAPGSIEPSACSTSRPAAFAFWIAPRESPARAA